MPCDECFIQYCRMEGHCPAIKEGIPPTPPRENKVTTISPMDELRKKKAANRTILADDIFGAAKDAMVHI